MPLVHATCVADPATGRAILLRGPPGSGKSDLALRLIDQGWQLVSDDQTDLVARGGKLVATAPATIAGKLEVRGIGIVTLPHRSSTELGLVIDLVPAVAIDRLPAPASCALQGVELPLLRLDPFQPSAAAKVRLAVRGLAGE